MYARSFTDEPESEKMFAGLSHWCAENLPGLVSVWRTHNLERDRWWLIVCDESENIDTLDYPLTGEPSMLTVEQATAFANRRIETINEETGRRGDGETFSIFTHYEQGKQPRLNRDGEWVFKGV